jgi:hypothetical protein
MAIGAPVPCDFFAGDRPQTILTAELGVPQAAHQRRIEMDGSQCFLCGFSSLHHHFCHNESLLMVWGAREAL